MPSGGMRPKAILVTGMHRSGTSALARIINLHGAAIGSRLLEATSDNVNGYWENWHVVMFHERVLRELDMAWDSASAIPASWTETNQFLIYVDELCELIESEFGDQQLWMVKDPRLCRLLPLWITALDRMGVEPKFVFEVRHPVEVISSLIKRDGLGAGLASLLWLDYLATPMAETRRCSRALLDYEEILVDWRGCMSRLTSDLGIQWPVLSESCAVEVDAHLDPSMRHHRAEASSLLPEPWREEILQVFEACLLVSRNSATWDILEERLRSAMKIIHTVEPLARDLAAPSQVVALQKEVQDMAALRQQLVSLTGELEQSRADALSASDLAKRAEQDRFAVQQMLLQTQRITADTQRCLAQANAYLEAERQNVMDLTAEARIARNQLTELTSLLNDTRGALDNERRNVADLAATAEATKSHLVELTSLQKLANEHSNQLAAELRQQKDQLRDILQSHSWRITRPLRVLTSLLRGDFEYIRRGMRARKNDAPRAAMALDSFAVPVVPRHSLAELVRGLSFERADNAGCAVVVLADSDGEQVGRALQAIARQRGHTRLDVSVMAESMAADDVAMLRQLSGLSVVATDQLSDVMSSIRGEYVLLIRAGVLVSDGCVDALVGTLVRRSDVLMAGPKVLDSDGRIREAGTIVWRDGSDLAFGVGLSANHYATSYVKNVDACGDSAVLVRKSFLMSAIEKVSTNFRSRSSWINFALWLREQGEGGGIVYQPKAIVVDDQALRITGKHEIAQRQDHWASVLDRDHDDAVNGDFRARDRMQHGKTILVVDHSAPQPDRDAGSRSIWHFMRMFQRRGMNLKFWPHNQLNDALYVEKLQQEGIEVILGHEGGFSDWLGKNLQSVDIVLVSRPHVALEYIVTVRRLSSLRILYYGHDIHYLRLEAQLKHRPSAQLEQDAKNHLAWEQSIWPTVDAIYYPAEGETQYVRAWLEERGRHDIPVRTIPVYAFEPFADEPSQNLADRHGILFVGGFAHAPNADAAEWFVHEVMPRIVKERHDAHLYLLGSNPTTEVLALAGKNVTVIGYVSEEDLLDYYKRVRVSVAPLRFGAGMKGKVIEAMRYGLPCSMTSIGAQGLEDVPFLAVSDDPTLFADNVLRMLNDDEYWTWLSQSEQQLVRERFSEEALWGIVRPDIAPVLFPSG